MPFSFTFYDCDVGAPAVVATSNLRTVKLIVARPPVSFPIINIVADLSDNNCSFAVISNSMPDTVTDWAASLSPTNCGTVAAELFGADLTTLNFSYI
jgi:hypothetical protein